MISHSQKYRIGCGIKDNQIQLGGVSIPVPCPLLFPAPGLDRRPKDETSHHLQTCRKKFLNITFEQGLHIHPVFTGVSGPFPPICRYEDLKLPVSFKHRFRLVFYEGSDPCPVHSLLLCFI